MNYLVSLFYFISSAPLLLLLLTANRQSERDARLCCRSDAAWTQTSLFSVFFFIQLHIRVDLLCVLVQIFTPIRNVLRRSLSLFEDEKWQSDETYPRARLQTLQTEIKTHQPSTLTPSGVDKKTSTEKKTLKLTFWCMRNEGRVTHVVCHRQQKTLILVSHIFTFHRHFNLVSCVERCGGDKKTR